MDNYWYYTLSAIPQTLAAMIALAATFVVFKLSFIFEQIRKNRSDLSRFILLLTSFMKKEIHDIEPLNDRDFIKLYEKGLANIKEDQDYFGLDKGIYEKLVSEMDRIIQSDEWRSLFKAKPFRIYGYLNMKKNILKRLVDARMVSLRWLFWSLLITILTMAASLSVLPIYDIFSNPPVVVTSILLASLISIFLTACSVWKIATVRF